MLIDVIAEDISLYKCKNEIKKIVCQAMRDGKNTSAKCDVSLGVLMSCPHLLFHQTRTIDQRSHLFVYSVEFRSF